MQAYVDAVSALQNCMRVMDEDAYNDLYWAMEDARAQARETRLAYTDHVAEHGC
jgi:hypothetical protein